MKYSKSLNANILAGSIITLAILFRLLLITLGWPALNSDEGTMGLMGIHILTRGEHPIFFYGQNYMGALEAYLAAFFFRFFEISTLALRLGLIMMLISFFIVMYLLAKKLYTPKFAIFSLIILALGSKYILNKELVAVGGAVETLLCGSLLFLLTLIIVTESQAAILLLFWGLTAGVGLWSHLLITPFILFSGLVLTICYWRQLINYKSLMLILGFIIGSLPLMYYNLHALPGEDSLSVFRQIHQESGFPHPSIAQLFPLQIKGATLISLPLITGAIPLCTTQDVLPTNLHLLHSIPCIFSQIIWPLGVIAMWLYALWQTIVAMRKMNGLSNRKSGEIQIVRLCLLLTAGITYILYVASPAAAMYPVTTSRYLIGLLIVTPALLWPFWDVKNILKRIALILITCIFFLGSITIFSEIPSMKHQLQSQETLIKILLQNNLRHIYSEYWTCNRLIFQTKEQIICGVINAGLAEGQNRYPEYYTIVSNDPQSAYVFPNSYVENNPINETLSQEGYTKIYTPSYIIYKPSKMIK
jgi:hypothetical protein